MSLLENDLIWDKPAVMGQNEYFASNASDGKMTTFTTSSSDQFSYHLVIGKHSVKSRSRLGLVRLVNLIFYYMASLFSLANFN